MATIKIQRANWRAREVMANLRESDKDELRVLQHETLFEQALATSAESWMALVDDEVGCVWGVIDPPGLAPARLWLFGTPLINEHKKTFLRWSRLYTSNALARFGWLTAEPSNERSLRWLHWIGFTGEPLQMRL